MRALTFLCAWVCVRVCTRLCEVGGRAGKDFLMKGAGRDCTALFNEYHVWNNFGTLESNALVALVALVVAWLPLALPRARECHTSVNSEINPAGAEAALVLWLLAHALPPAFLRALSCVQPNKYHAWVNFEFMLEKCCVGVLDPADSSPAGPPAAAAPSL
eukprot:jgi/Mesen1/4075/ME000213S03102